MNQKTTIDTLNGIIDRIDSFISPVTPNNLKLFFDGFKQGNISAREDLDFSDYINAWCEAVKLCGWKVNSISIEKEMREKELSDNEIIQELLKIELETWKILENNQK
jgi:hypothetical protein